MGFEDEESTDDTNLECVDCHTMFVFTSGEATFFKSKGFSAPRRCKPCRDAKKQQSGSSGNRSFDRNR